MTQIDLNLPFNGDMRTNMTKELILVLKELTQHLAPKNT